MGEGGLVQNTQRNQTLQRSRQLSSEATMARTPTLSLVCIYDKR